MDKVQFNEKKHIYTRNGIKIPNVTGIISSVIPRDFNATEWQMNRGTAVHRAMALFMQGRLNEKSVDERIRGKVEAGKRAVKELSLNPPYIIEQELYHPLYNYAGKPDVLAHRTLVDWKSSSDKITEIQMGGYYLLFDSNGYKVKKLLEIVLSDNGKYKVTEFKIPRSKRLFLSCLTMHNFLTKKGG